MIYIILSHDEEYMLVVKMNLLNPLVYKTEIVHFMDFSEGNGTSTKHFLSHFGKERSQVDRASPRVCFD